MLDADGEADIAGGDAGGGLLGFGELRMGGAGPGGWPACGHRQYWRRGRSASAGRMNRRPASRPPASSKPTRPPFPFGRYLALHSAAMPVAVEGWMTRATFGCCFRKSTTACALSQWARMRSANVSMPLQDQERIERADGGAEVAQQGGAGLQYIGDGARAAWRPLTRPRRGSWVRACSGRVGAPCGRPSRNCRHR